MSENKSIWNKLKNETITYDDIEQYIFTKEYISALDHPEIIYSGKEYNDALLRYFFEVESYDTEDDYEEVFFQSYLDGDISKEYYFEHENKFMKMLEILFNKSETIIYYCLDMNLENNHPLKMSTDISVDIKQIEKNNDKFFVVKDFQLFRQICYLAGREIQSINFIFPDIKCILMNSGLHGYIFAESLLDADLEKSISSVLKFGIIDD